MQDVINKFMPKMLAIGLILSIISILVGGYLKYYEEEVKESTVWPFIQTLEPILLFVMGLLALFSLSVTIIVILLE